MAKRFTILLTSALCLICLAPDSKPATPPAGKSYSVSIKGMKFDPEEFKIAVGDTVVWTNNDDRDHTVIAKDQSFKSGNLSKGDTFKHKFTAAGQFSYGCSYHPRMKGVVVIANSRSAP